MIILTDSHPASLLKAAEIWRTFTPYFVGPNESDEDGSRREIKEPIVVYDFHHEISSESDFLFNLVERAHEEWLGDLFIVVNDLPWNDPVEKGFLQQLAGFAEDLRQLAPGSFSVNWFCQSPQDVCNKTPKIILDVKNNEYFNKINEHKKELEDTLNFIEFRISLIRMGFIEASQGIEQIVKDLVPDERSPVFEVGEKKRVERFVKKGRPSLAGGSQKIKNLKERIVKVANTDLAVLINGETGTGKEAIAFFLHDFSSRKGKDFVTCNCAGLSDDLLESELFGHVKGSFTGAEKHEGLVKKYDGGTLFLDELPDMSERVQAKLLRFLQSGEYWPLGSNEPQQANMRVVAAGQPDLLTKNIRRDLYYRLAEVEIDVPNLQDQKNEILNIVINLAARLIDIKVGGRAVSIDDVRRAVEYFKRGEDELQRHEWEGNVRELQRYVKRRILLGDDVLEEIRQKKAEVLRKSPCQLKQPECSVSASSPSDVTDVDKWWNELLAIISSLKVTKLEGLKKRQDFEELEATYLTHICTSLKGQEKRSEVLKELGCASGTYEKRKKLLDNRNRQQKN